MTKPRAEQLIVISLFVLLASTVGSKLAGEQVPGQEKHFGRKIVGGFLTMFFASLFAEAAPEVGALLAISVASYAFFHEGLPTINKITGSSNQQIEQEKKKVKPQAQQRVGPEVASPSNLGGTLV